MKLSFIFYEPVSTLSELDQRMAQLAALGYQGVELTACHPMPYSIDEVTALASKHRLPVVSLLSGWSYSNEGLCLASPRPEIRERAVARLIEYVSYAARLRAVQVIGQMQGLRSDEPDEAHANSRIEQGLRAIAQAAVEHRATLVLEPVNHFQVGFNHTAQQAAAMVQRVGSAGLSYMLDTIHMNIEERSLLETIRVHGRHIHHFHLCETNGGPFGSGGLDFPSVLKALAAVDYSHFVSVKIYRQATWVEAAQGAIALLREKCR